MGKFKIYDENGEERINLDPSYVYTVLIPYSYNPDESFRRSVDIIKYLRKHQLTVFSPITHLHHYNIECKKKNPQFIDDYYNWDLKIYSHFNKMIAIITKDDWDKSDGVLREIKWCKDNNIPLLYIVE